MIKHLKSGVREYYTLNAFVIDFKGTALLEVWIKSLWQYDIPSARKLFKYKLHDKYRILEMITNISPMIHHKIS